MTQQGRTSFLIGYAFMIGPWERSSKTSSSEFPPAVVHSHAVEHRRHEGAATGSWSPRRAGDLVAWAGFQQSKLADRPPVRVEIPNHPIQIDTSRRLGGGIIAVVGGLWPNWTRGAM